MGTIDLCERAMGLVGGGYSLGHQVGSVATSIRKLSI